MSCGESISQGCTCSLQSERPVAEAPEVLATFFRYELLAEEVEVLELPLALLEFTEETPVWFTADEVPRDDFFLALSSFPNPPPASA